MRIGISITKKTLFRDFDQEFSNTYHYELETAVTAPSESIVDEIVAKEKTLHSTVVTFVRAKVWTAGGTKAQNSMIFAKNLSGTGTQTVGANMDRERAVLVMWRAGFDSRGLPVYLRKWFHSCGDIAAQNMAPSSVIANTTFIAQAARDAIAASVDGLTRVGSQLWDLCSEKGRHHNIGVGPTAHKYLEHHQLGDMWRG